jgi:hypothetical protein
MHAAADFLAPDSVLHSPENIGDDILFFWKAPHSQMLRIGVNETNLQVKFACVSVMVGCLCHFPNRNYKSYHQPTIQRSGHFSVSRVPKSSLCGTVLRAILADDFPVV